MDTLEPKKLAILRIAQILQRHSNPKHPLTQDEIMNYLNRDYGIAVERKTIGRNISLLKEAGMAIESCKDGSYLKHLDFEEAELKLLIDCVLCSQHINPKQSSDLIEKLCKLSNKYFRSHVKNIHTVKDWNKTDNPTLFRNIEMVDTAIEKEKQLQYDYNKYGTDKRMHKSSFQRVTPYQLILHNQRYYLMGYSDYWQHMVFHRLDRIHNISLYDQPAHPLRNIPGYEQGIDYRKISSTMPYMYTDDPERIEFMANINIVDQIIDWFGKDIIIRHTNTPDEIIVSLLASPTAMEYWSLQYLNHVEIITPVHLRDRIKNTLTNALQKYSSQTQNNVG